MFTVMLIFHTLVCIFLVVVILMQAAKGEGLAGAFGGGGGLSGAVFGGRGAATFLSKATTVLAIVFMVNCSILAFMSSRRTGGLSDAASSVVVEEAQKEMERQAAEQQAIPPASDNADGSLFPTDGTPTEGSQESLFPTEGTTDQTPTDQQAEPAGSGG